jgi:hypothetical protein
MAKDQGDGRNPCKLNEGTVVTRLQGLLSRSHDFFFGPWPLSEDADVQLIWEQLLSLAVLHIYMENLKRGRNFHFYLRTVHPRGGVT